MGGPKTTKNKDLDRFVDDYKNIRLQKLDQSVEYDSREGSVAGSR